MYSSYLSESGIGASTGVNRRQLSSDQVSTHAMQCNALTFPVSTPYTSHTQVIREL